jgi:hypothetical protein
VPKSSAPPATSGHQQRRTRQVAGEISVNDFLHFTSGERDRFDTICGKHIRQWSGNSAANQRLHFQIRQSGDPLNWVIICNYLLSFSDDRPIFDG